MGNKCKSVKDFAAFFRISGETNVFPRWKQKSHCHEGQLVGCSQYFPVLCETYFPFHGDLAYIPGSDWRDVPQKGSVYHGPKTRLSGCGAKLGKVIRKMTAIPSEQIIVVAGILLGRGLRLRFEHGNGKQWIVLKRKHVLLRWRFPKCGYRQIIQH